MYCLWVNDYIPLSLSPQAARNALRGEDVLLQLSEDWAALDLTSVVAQTLYAIQPLDIPPHYVDMVPQCEFVNVTTPYPITVRYNYMCTVLDDFAGLLSEDKCSVEDFAMWVDDIIEKCFKKVCV